MTLYHYTSADHLRQILADGVIKTTHSNLLRPVNPQIVNGQLIDPATDNYKPVVWLSDTLDFEAAGNGLTGGVMDKTECAIAIEARIYHDFRKWDKWAKANNADKAWTETLKATARSWRTWYISERPIAIDDSVKICFRPDILAELRQQDQGGSEPAQEPAN